MLREHGMWVDSNVYVLPCDLITTTSIIPWVIIQPTFLTDHAIGEKEYLITSKQLLSLFMWQSVVLFFCLSLCLCNWLECLVWKQRIDINLVNLWLKKGWKKKKVECEFQFGWHVNVYLFFLVSLIICWRIYILCTFFLFWYLRTLVLFIHVERPSSLPSKSLQNKVLTVSSCICSSGTL